MELVKNKQAGKFCLAWNEKGVEFAALLSRTARSRLTPFTVALGRYRTSTSYGDSFRSPVLGAAANFPVFCFPGCATKFKFHQHFIAHCRFYLSTTVSSWQNTTLHVYSIMWSCNFTLQKILLCF